MLACMTHLLARLCGPYAWCAPHSLRMTRLLGATTWLPCSLSECCVHLSTLPPFCTYFLSPCLNCNCHNIFHVSWVSQGHLEVPLCIPRNLRQYAHTSLRTGAYPIYLLLTNPPPLDEVDILVWQISKYVFTWSSNRHRFISCFHVVLALPSPSHSIRKFAGQFFLLAPCVLWSRIFFYLFVIFCSNH